MQHQRFAIKIDKSVKARLKNVCRLCGIGNPNQVYILNAAEWIDLTIDDEVPLSRKIIECVGIEVMKTDKMPQQICPMCIDKINDFYEFREMCQATNVQTRKLLNLPDTTKIKAPKKVTIKTDEDAVESILGISGTDTKAKVEPASKASKKSKKATASTSTTTKTNENRFRGMTKREIEITLELERIKKEEEDEKMAIIPEIAAPPPAAATGRMNNGKKKKGNAKTALDTPLLAPKAPNQRERKREMEQKRIEKKRKLDTKIKAPVTKKIKKEPGVSCLVCVERFERISLRDAHLQAMHRPTIFNYACGTCYEEFTTLEECTSHNEWHWKNNLPHKCTICNESFPKLINFQSHFSECVNPSFASATEFAGNIFCGNCNLEYETQNLYDWHACFIGDNSRCPQCQRIFIKRTVLLKHMFKCTGLPSGTVPMAVTTAITPALGSAVPPKRQKGRPKGKKKTVRGVQKAQNKLDVSAQNSFKFEPETIIEQHGDDDDGGDYDAVDDSFMDTHFADSDTEFEPSNSIITSTGLDMPNSPAKQPEHDNATINPNESQIPSVTNANTAVRSSIDVPLSLLECHVKLEPLDVASLVPSSIPQVSSIHPHPVVERPLTVPPLTIRIKKEVIRPGYGDEFDVNLAQNIKQERVDETYELAGRSLASAQSNVHKKSKHRDKEKKLYKKPALLAIKIKQERMEREANDDDDYGESYPDYSVSTDDYSMPSDMAVTSFDGNPLPIITQIHSVIDAGPSLPTVSQIAITPSISSQPTNHVVPFIPIRIKSEFQRPLSPPQAPAEIIDSTSIAQHPQVEQQLQEDDNEKLLHTQHRSDYDTQLRRETNEKSESQIDNSEQPSDETVDSTMVFENSHDKSTGNECLQMEHTTEEHEHNENDKHSSQVECDTSSSVNGDIQPDGSEIVDSTAKNDNDLDAHQRDAIIENSSSQNCIGTTDDQPVQHDACETVENTSQMEIVSEADQGIADNSKEACSENLEKNQSMHDDDAIACHSSLEVVHLHTESTSLNATELMDSANAASVDIGIDIDMEEIDPPQISSSFTGINTGILQPINEICDVSNALDFIDQLVHEVADTMVAPPPDDAMVCDVDENVAKTNVSFMATEFNYNVGCTMKSAEHNESDAQAIAGVAKSTTVNDTLLALSDIPDIDCDLLPVLSANECTSNGNKLDECKSTEPAQSPLPIDNNVLSGSSSAAIINYGSTDANIQNDQPKLPLN